MTLFTYPDVFAPLKADGTPNSPDLGQAYVLTKELMNALQMALFDGLIYSTRAALYADLAHAANSWALVIGDPTSGYDGLYQKSGASGSGSWSRKGDVPGSGFIKGTDSGAGTPNAIQVTSPTIPATDGAALIVFNIFEANTGSPVTVSFNGGTALTIKTNTGNNVASGGLTANMMVAGFVSGSTFRLISDQVSSAIVAAAEAAQAAAEDARDEAVAAAASIVPSKFNSQAVAAAATISALTDFIEVGGLVYQRISATHPRLGPEEVSNGALASDTVWTKGSGWSISAGVASKAAGSATNLSQSITLEAVPYFFSYQITAISASFFRLALGSTFTTSETTTGTKSGVATSTASSTFLVNASSTTVGSVDNISLKRLPADAFSSNGGTVWWARPDAVSPHVPASPAQMTVFGIVGQSNALGAAAGGDMTINPNVFVYRPTTGTIEVCDPTLSPIAGANNNAGFHVAKRYQERHGGQVLLLVIAQGSTAISEFLPGGSQWTKMTTDVPAALALAGQTYVDRWFFSQGESDQGRGTIVYMRDVETFLTNMKAQPYWLAGHTYMIGTEMTDSWLNASQGQGLALRLLAEKTSDFVMMSSFDLPVDAAAPIHFSGQGLVELGYRFADMAMLPYGGGPRPSRFRFATSNIFFTIDPAGGSDVDFTSFENAMAFFSTIYIEGLNSIATVTIRGQITLVSAIGIRPSLQQGSQWVFVGQLAGGFSQPTKGNISGTKATALTYLRTQYSTEIRSASTLMVLNGMNVGLWKDILFSASAAGASAGCLQSNDGSVSRAHIGGAARLINCAFHGFDGTNGGALILPNHTDVEGANLTFAHCYNGIVASLGSSVKAASSVFAYCTRDASATYGAVVDVSNSTTTSSSSSGWLASTRGYVDARGAENIGAVSATTNGIVQTA